MFISALGAYVPRADMTRFNNTLDSFPSFPEIIKIPLEEIIQEFIIKFALKLLGCISDGYSLYLYLALFQHSNSSPEVGLPAIAHSSCI